MKSFESLKHTMWECNCHVVSLSTVGADKASIREYIRNQERDDQRFDQMNQF